MQSLEIRLPVAGFGLMDELGHFPGRDVVISQIRPAFCLIGEIGVEFFGFRSEPHFQIPVLTAVGVQLYEEPVGSPLDMDSGLHPACESLPGGRSSAVEVTVFHTREETEFPIAPLGQQRSLDQEEMVRRCRDSGLRRDPAIMGFRTSSPILRVVDAVEDFRLRVGGGRGHCEIGVTAGLSQDGQFIIDSAPFSIRSGVAQGPISMNESVDDFARDRILAEQSMPMEQLISKLGQFRSQGFRSVSIVMQVNFDIPESRLTQQGEPIEIFRTIFILWEEE